MPLATSAIRGTPFRHPAWPDLPLEALALRTLRKQAPAADLCRPRRPAFHLLLLCTGGEGFHTVDFQRLPLAPGTVLHVRPGQVHAFGGSADLDGVLLRYAPEALLPELPEDLPTILRPAGEDLERVAAAFGDLLAEHRRFAGGRLPAQVLRHLLAVLLLRLADREPAPVGRGRPAVFDRFEADVERSFLRTRSVADYARRLDCSERTLVRACRAAVGHGPKAVLSARILLEAKRLLVHSDWNVARISVLLGFAEPTNFAKFFRKGAGTSPERFREQETG